MVGATTPETLGRAGLAVNGTIRNTETFPCLRFHVGLLALPLVGAREDPLSVAAAGRSIGRVTGGWKMPGYVI
jgi:hypothetical protein